MLLTLVHSSTCLRMPLTVSTNQTYCGAIKVYIQHVSSLPYDLGTAWHALAVPTTGHDVSASCRLHCARSTHICMFPGGSATVPEGTVHVELCDGRMGTTKLEEATVDANLDSQQRFTFTCHLVPTSNRQSGYVHLDGSMPVVLDWMPAVQVDCSTDD